MFANGRKQKEGKSGGRNGSRSATLPRRKKFAYGFIIFCMAMAPIYIVSEIVYRKSLGVPSFLFSPELQSELAPVSSENTWVMDFQSVYYYDIFQESSIPALGYEPKPNYVRGAVSINSHGIRDREFPLEKGPRTVCEVLPQGAARQ